MLSFKKKSKKKKNFVSRQLACNAKLYELKCDTQSAQEKKWKYFILTKANRIVS